MKSTILLFLAAIGHAFAAAVTQPGLSTEITDPDTLGQAAAQPADIAVVLRPKGKLPPPSGPSPRTQGKSILLEDDIADTTTGAKQAASQDSDVMMETTTESPGSAIDDPDFVLN